MSTSSDPFPSAVSRDTHSHNHEETIKSIEKLRENPELFNSGKQPIERSKELEGWERGRTVGDGEDIPVRDNPGGFSDRKVKIEREKELTEAESAARQSA
ncbi:hypothetical protein T439DRAFT_320031 [Meredithblackwellia eburnea MCA 4105]